MTLYEECIKSLDNNYEIIINEEKEHLLKSIFASFRLTNWGKINWSLKENYIKLNDFKEVINYLKRLGIDRKFEFYIIWDQTDLPLIKTDFNLIFSMDDILAVSFDTWLFVPQKNLIIEFYHDGDITIGINNF
ncbi:MAG: hypothetical protein N4A54_13940 [Peptostreptococcaceae bacterium]|jgi:hypothetical protein|nr:hypothetical protein [Peptostreptococcaceae bacterium]